MAESRNNSIDTTHNIPTVNFDKLPKSTEFSHLSSECFKILLKLHVS